MGGKKILQKLRVAANITSNQLWTTNNKCIHCTGCLVSPRTGLDIEAKGTILCLCQRSNLNRPVIVS
jgi:hypothetical protein